MSIATELTNYKNFLTNAYTKCADKNATIPANKNLQNLTSCIDSIPNHIKLTYIESNGTQYIDTGIKPNANIHCVVDFQLTDIPTQSQGIIGGWQASKGMLFGVRYANNVSNFQFAFGTSAWAGNTITADLERHTLYMNDSNGDARLDNTVLASHSNVVSLTNTTYNIWLMKINGGVSYSCSAKIYSCQMYDNNTLIRDYIPVLYYGIPCLYDKVEHKYYFNQGTGTFTAGDVVLDYIESTGTQYLISGVPCRVNTKVNMKVMFPQISSSNAWFFGINYTNNLLVSLGINASYPRFQFRAPTNLIYTISPTISANTKHEVEAYFGESSQYIKIDGTSRLSRTDTYVNGSSQGSFRIFNRIDQGDANLNMRLYSCKIYENDVLKADFLPIIRASDGLPCLYDKTRNSYVTNGGTGTFLFG